MSTQLETPVGESFDLRAYLDRIGIREPHPPTLETLRRIHLAHVQTIAFENLNPLLGMRVSLDLPDLERKLVMDGRGGYCFEQNLLFQAALAHLGFRTTALLARVVWGGQVTARTHLLLLITLSARQWIADVGFGGMTLTGPIELKHATAQPTPHEHFRLLRSDEEWTLEAQIKDDWKPLYRFDLRTPLSVDLEVGNWYCSTHPDSHFTNELIAARPAPGCRHTLAGNALTTHWLDGKTDKRLLQEPDELREVLCSVFGVNLPDHPRLHSVFIRATDGPERTDG